MSMTENEAIKILKKPTEYIRIYDNDFVFPSDFAKAYEAAIKALEEIQQYRALEEKLNGISVEQVVNGFISTVKKQTHEDYKRGRILTNKEADEWNELQAIGTMEEFKALKEKQYDCTIKHLTNECSYKETGCSDCKGYWKIRELLEKNEPKKDNNDGGRCKCCGTYNNFIINKLANPKGHPVIHCWNCGQAIDWQ